MRPMGRARHSTMGDELQGLHALACAAWSPVRSAVARCARAVAHSSQPRDLLCPQATTAGRAGDTVAACGRRARSCVRNRQSCSQRLKLRRARALLTGVSTLYEQRPIQIGTAVRLASAVPQNAHRVARCAARQFNRHQRARNHARGAEVHSKQRVFLSTPYTAGSTAVCARKERRLRRVRESQALHASSSSAGMHLDVFTDALPKHVYLAAGRRG